MRAKDGLAIGADIDEERQFFHLVHLRAQHPGADIGPYVTGDAGQAIDNRLRGRDEAQLRGGQHRHVVDDRHVRRQADRLGGDGQQQVDHRGVAGNCDLEYLVRGCACLLAGGPEQPIDRADDQGLHLGQVVALAGINDARDDVLAARDLTVIIGRLADYLSTQQIHQPDGDGSGADVDGRAVTAIRLVPG